MLQLFEFVTGFDKEELVGVSQRAIPRHGHV